VEMDQRQGKSTYNNIKNKTSPESSPPPTPTHENCNVDKAEENDLKNSLMKMLEEAFEEKMKNAFKEIEFIYMVDYIDSFLYVEPSLHLWNEAHLMMVDDLFGEETFL
ncbi:hypothetical protein STEG23_016817, partial [Scotinomys teguina]